MNIPGLKKHEFRPDRRRGRQLDTLWPTPRQQLRILRWILYGLLCLVGLVLQDVALCRIRVLGGCTDLLPALVMTVAAVSGAHSGSVFALVAAVAYFFSGSSAGTYVIAVLTAAAVGVSIFRQAFLRRGFWAVMLCLVLGMTAYEMAVFAINLFLKLTVPARAGAALATAGLSVLCVPVCYPVVLAIGKLGGEAWGE